MFGIVDENKKFILIDEDLLRLRTTALILSKETESGFIPMFDEKTVDELIKQYSESEIKTHENGDKYLK